MSKVCIVVLCGLPAAGKSTFVHKLESFVQSESRTEKSDVSHITASTSEDLARDVESCDSNQSSLISHQLVHICYDELMPAELESKLVADADGLSSAKSSGWKSYRKSILRCVEEFILKPLRSTSSHSTPSHSTPNENEIVVRAESATEKCCPTPETFPRTSPMTVADYNKMSREATSESLLQDVPSELSERFSRFTRSVSRFSSRCHYLIGHSPRPVVVVFDDNMYYTSMRYEVYRLARNYSTGYVQLYFPVEVSVACERNRHRSTDCSRVTQQVIEAMGERFERPCPHDNSWETRTVEIHNCHQQQIFAQVLSTIEEAVENPPPLSTAQTDSFDAAAAEDSRNICLASLSHRVDGTLRKLIGLRVQTFKDSGSRTNVDTSTCARKLNARRIEILNDLRTGKFILPKMNCSVENCGHELEANRITDQHLRSGPCPSSETSSYIESALLHSCQLTIFLNHLLNNYNSLIPVQEYNE